ncbi:MAG: hypothetical protein H0U40_01845 [Chloroflexia bacterium]|nr:hypothetical protein [Chloroflexia bacterium]
MVERTRALMNGIGTLHRGTDTCDAVVEFFVCLASTFVVTRCPIREARTRYRRPGRPTS